MRDLQIHNRPQIRAGLKKKLNPKLSLPNFHGSVTDWPIMYPLNVRTE